MIKFFKKEKNFEKKRLGLNLYFFWKLAVGFMFVSALVSLFFGYYLFGQINKETVLSSGATSGKVDTVKKERIEKVLEYFSLRKKTSNKIMTYPPAIVDPSL